MSDERNDELPPGHPASADDMITAGEVLSGRGRGRGGLVSAAEEDDDAGADDR